MKPDTDFDLLLEVTRGPIVESIHTGAVAVVDAGGALLASTGNPDVVTYLRSSAKPLQALAFVEQGGVEHFGMSESEVAILCGSHSGTDEHVALLGNLQQRMGISEENLLCGTHAPFHEPTWRSMILQHEAPTPIRHNCSGKHTGMLGLALLNGWGLEDYINIQHPVQQVILKTFAEMCDLATADVAVGIDGCSVPVFGVPLRAAALAFARLADPTGLPPGRAAACRTITHAMTARPDMVAGPARFDTRLMQVGGGRIFCKGGAEGYTAIGLLPGVLEGRGGVGIAIKIADGDTGQRARTSAFESQELNDGDLESRADTTVAMEVLRQLGALSPGQQDDLRAFDRRPISNWRGLQVGEIRPVFNLKRA